MTNMIGPDMNNRWNKKIKISLAKTTADLLGIIAALRIYFLPGVSARFRTPGWSFLRDQSAPYWYM
jgi:hypothetical protein